MTGAVPHNKEKDLYRPTYKKLLSYSDFETLRGLGVIEMKPNFEKTIQKIKEIVNDYRGEVRGLSNHLRDEKFYQTCYNIWHFCKYEIRYKLDKQALEQIRTAAQTLKDRRKGVDCEDYTIFIACVLKDLGVERIQAVTTSYSEDKKPEHIFIKIQNMFIDPVWANCFEIPYKERLTDLKIWTLY